jgi:ubiquitin-conjugating enzyme E2 S
MRASCPVFLSSPAGTPFEGGLFKMKLLLPSDFPAGAPKGAVRGRGWPVRPERTPPSLSQPCSHSPGFFVTKIFHPNIRYTTGEICVNTLKRDWQPTHGIRHVLMVVRCLLIEPFPESALNEEAAKMLLEEYDEYFRRARMMTSIHARNDRKGQAAAAEGGEAGASALGNATNFMSVRADENDDGRAPAANGEPPLKKLDRKKSLKRL